MQLIELIERLQNMINSELSVMEQGKEFGRISVTFGEFQSSALHIVL